MDGKGTVVAEPGEPDGRATASFTIAIAPVVAGGQSTPLAYEHLYFAIPSGSATFDVNDRGVAKRFAGDGSIAAVEYFDPTVGVDLGEGSWVVELSLRSSSPGVKTVAMSFDAAFPSGNTAFSAVEFCPVPLTVANWFTGVHSGVAYINDFPDLDFDTVTLGAPFECVQLEPLWRSRWSQLGAPSLAWSVIEGSPEFAVGPTLEFDKGLDTYVIRAVSATAGTIRCTVTIDDWSLVVDVAF